MLRGPVYHLQVAIYHDPGKGTNTEGQTIKQLKIQPTPDGKVRSLTATAAHHATQAN